MRKVTLFIASSLDNLIASEDGGIDWLFSDGDYGYKQFYDSIDTVLMGRKTYELALTIGEHFTGKTCYVFSRHERALEAVNGRFVSDPTGLVSHLLNQPGKGIYLEGGGETISSFLNENLIDDIILSVHPIVLGKGVPLFKNIVKQINLKLLKSTPFESGLIQLHYKVIENSSQVQE